MVEHGGQILIGLAGLIALMTIGLRILASSAWAHSLQPLDARRSTPISAECAQFGEELLDSDR